MTKNQKRSIAALARLSLSVLAVALAVLLTFSLAAVAAFIIPPQYSDTYFAGLGAKYARLAATDDIEGDRVIIIGGSGATFGINNDILEHECNKTVVNMSLYAALGCKNTVNAVKKHLRRGDTVILMLEYSDQMYSLYTDPVMWLQAAESEPRLLRALDSDDIPDTLANLGKFVSTKLGLYFKKQTPHPTGVYSSSSFDASGNLVFERKENIMDGGYDASSAVDFNDNIISDDFAAFINDFHAYAQKRGASVCFSFCPVNELAVKPESDDAMQKFVGTLNEKFDCEIISDITQRVYGAGCFYDSNYHLNDTGAIINTALLALDLKREADDMTGLSFEIPDEPVLSEDSGGDELHDGNFIYRISDSGDATLTGIKDPDAVGATLEIPATLGDAAVTKIASGALKNISSLTEVCFPASVASFGSGVFDGCSSLSTITLLCEVLPAIGDSFLEGTSENIIFRVPSDMYSDYVIDYFWARYAESIREIK